MGTPERPISDLGLVSYRSYWVYALLEILAKHRGAISIAELSEMTKFRTDDIVKTLQVIPRPPTPVMQLTPGPRQPSQHPRAHTGAWPHQPRQHPRARTAAWPHMVSATLTLLLQAFNLIRYFGGQHSIYVSPKTLETYYTKAKPNWLIDQTKIPSWYQPYSKRLPSANKSG